MAEAARSRRRERAHWIAILCQAQGAKVTAADLLGEKNIQAPSRAKELRAKMKQISKRVHASKERLARAGFRIEDFTNA